MKYFFVLISLFFAGTPAEAQFQPTNEGLIIMVSDGTERGRNSEVAQGSDVPTSYDQVGQKSASSPGGLTFTDPIYELGMTDCIQAAAFLERPEFGKAGFMLIFSLNDAIGGQQGTLSFNGTTYKGVYRLIRQKTSPDETIPEKMTSYRIRGTFFLLGVS